MALDRFLVLQCESNRDIKQMNIVFARMAVAAFGPCVAPLWYPGDSPEPQQVHRERSGGACGGRR